MSEVTPEFLEERASLFKHRENLDHEAGMHVGCYSDCPACALKAAAQALRAEREKRERAESERNQLANFNPDWDMLRATQDSLREQWAENRRQAQEIKRKDQQLADLRWELSPRSDEETVSLWTANIGEICIGMVHEHRLTSPTETRIAALPNLPSTKPDLGNFGSIEDAKAAIEQVWNEWLARAALSTTDTAQSERPHEWVDAGHGSAECAHCGAFWPASDSDLWAWFGLSYAAWLTIPRVLLHEMPMRWQNELAALLNEYQEAFPNQPALGTRVQVTDQDGKLTKAPEWLTNYRHPDRAQIDKLRPGRCPDCGDTKAGGPACVSSCGALEPEEVRRRRDAERRHRDARHG